MRRRRRDRPNLGPVMKEVGALSVPLALLLVVTASGFAWAGQAMHEWAQMRDRQWALSQCVARVSIRTALRLNRVRRLSQGMQVTRAALLVAVEPSLRASLQATLQLLATGVRTEELAWTAESASWLTGRGCGGITRAIAQPFPVRPWASSPPDPLGPQPPEWRNDHALCFRIWSPPRQGRAWVLFKGGRWQAQWRPASGPSSS
jgi:hypothetical protein